jgi:hypothetical protein
MVEEDFVKIVIDLPAAEDGVGGEGIWSVKVGEDLYEVRNSPWHTTDINFLDVVRAVAPAEDKNPVVTEVVRRGGHRSIHVVFLDDSKTHKEDVLGHLNELGATYENANGTLYAIDLKPDVDFDPIADYLSECQESGWLEQRYAPQPQPKGTGDLLN